MRKGKRQIISVLIGSLVLGSVTPAWAQSPADSSLELFSSGEEAEVAETAETGSTDSLFSDAGDSSVNIDGAASEGGVVDTAADETLLAEEITFDTDTAVSEETIADTAAAEETIADADTAVSEETIADADTAVSEETIADADTAATEETIADADDAVSEEIISDAGEAVADMANANSISVNATEVTIYTLDSKWTDVTIPSDLPTSFQIQVTGATGTPAFTSNSPNRLSVDQSGVLTPLANSVTVVNFSGSSYKQLEYYCGDYTVTVEVDGVTIPVTVHVADYVDYFVANKVQAFLEENITSSMTTYEKVEAIAKWIATTTDYSAEYSTYAELFVYGCGDCVATTCAVNYLCGKLGIPASMRDASNEAGAGSGHRNSLVKIDGTRYIVECGYAMDSPRKYAIRELPDFEYKEYMPASSDSSSGLSVWITRYNGYSMDLEIPAELNGKAVTKLGDFMLNSCPVDVNKVTIPASVVSLTKYALCGAAGSYEVSEDNTAYTSVDGIIYSKDMTVLVACPENRSEKVTVPEGVTEIADGAFYKCSSLTAVSLPSTLKTIGAYAFYDCSSLTELSLPSGTETIGRYAFENCNGLTSLSLGDSVTSIGTYAFGSCTSLEKLVIPATVETIGDYAFNLGPYQIQILGMSTTYTKLGVFYDNHQRYSNCMVTGLPGSRAESLAAEYKYPYANIETDGKVSIQDSWFATAKSSYSYTGDAIVPAVTVVKSSAVPKLTEGEDYTVIYQNNKDAGTASVIITGTGYYKGTVTKTFTITKKSLSYTSPVFTESGKTTVSVYSDGTPAEPEITIDGLTEGKDYTVTYSGNTQAGQAKAVITGIGNYEGTRTLTFYVYATITGIKAIADQTYTGQYLTPEFEVECALDAAGHYSTRWTNNRDAGTATVTVTGTGYYQGSVSATFKIAARDLDNSDITVFMVLTNNSAVYTGKAITPYVYANRSLNGNTFSLYKGTDFTVSYENNVNVGTATVTVNGIGNYCGSRTMTFTITAPTPTPTRAVTHSTSGGTTGGNTASGSTTNGTTGSGSTADGNTGGESAMDGNTGSGSTADGNTTSGTTTGGSATTGRTTDGRTTGADSANVADEETEANVTSANGTSASEKETTTTSLKKTKLKSVKSKKTKQITVSWKKVSGAQKYQIQICRKKNFKSGVKTKTVSGKKTAYTVKRLEKKTTYYVRVRAMKKVNGVWTYGAWSKTKKVKTK